VQLPPSHLTITIAMRLFAWIGHLWGIQVAWALSEPGAFAQRCRSFLAGHLANSQRPTVDFVAAGTNLTFYGTNTTCDHVAITLPTDLCRVALSVPTSTRSGVDVELWFPSNWTGRFLQTGNGGIDGCQPPPPQQVASPELTKSRYPIRGPGLRRLQRVRDSGVQQRPRRQDRSRVVPERRGHHRFCLESVRPSLTLPFSHVASNRVCHAVFARA
jgi:hypothetical protein